LCYSPVGAEDLEKKLSAELVQSMVKKLASMGHMSPFEHVSFTFAVEGISRVCSHQLVRHRIASYSQQSQRYVKEHNFETIMPPSIGNKPDARVKFISLCREIQDTYNKWVDEGILAEDARYILPNATETKVVITMNARSLLHFFELRCCNRAQWEIRAMANLMLQEVRKVAPVIFMNAGPTCETSRTCHEGKMSCGKLQELLKEDKKNK
jgi:thymidylate synthase (FAD)